jgi:small subunit ribosomal protein S6e
MLTMAQIRFNISQKGKSIQKELSEEESMTIRGKAIGEKISGDALGYAGYEFEITGGSDAAGMPMRADVPGDGRKRILAVEGIGVKAQRDGQRRRKLVAGRTIGENTSQVNVSVVKAGKQDLFAEPEPEAPAEESSEEAPKEEAPAKEE